MKEIYLIRLKSFERSLGVLKLPANKLIWLTDTAGYNATIAITTASNVTLYTAPAGKIIKGVGFFPLAPSAVLATDRIYHRGLAPQRAA